MTPTKWNLKFKNRGGGALSGTIATSALCLVADTYKIESASRAIRIQLDAKELSEGLHSYHLAVKSNGGDQIIPVRFAVVKRSQKAAAR